MAHLVLNWIWRNWAARQKLAQDFGMVCFLGCGDGLSGGHDALLR